MILLQRLYSKLYKERVYNNKTITIVIIKKIKKKAEQRQREGYIPKH